jgi:UDP-3-O-[3-hydroxymyristoyl] glucosamine N-acyltransferase
MYTLSELAKFTDGQIQGDANCQISGIGTLQEAQAGKISFLANPSYRKYLATTQASAIILTKDDLPFCQTNALIVTDPYAAFATLTHYFGPKENIVPGIHPSAVIAADAKIDPTCQIHAQVTIGSGTVIGANSVIGAGTVIGDNVQIGANVRLYPRVVLYDRVVIGDRVILHSGAVVGSDGFGFAFDRKQNTWIKINHLGTVLIGNDVEIGANTTIDRGALDNTVIEQHAKIDNLVQIAHNVQIGAFTVIAGCTGIAGSAKVGKYCKIGGGVCIAGHIEIADNISIVGMAMVTKSLAQVGGVYASGTGVMNRDDWRRNVARFRHLDELARRVRTLEKES